MLAYTDYPMPFLGDKKGEIAPTREVEVLSYDGNKYCVILVKSPNQIVKAEIKAGYLYSDRQQTKINTDSLPINTNTENDKSIRFI